MINIKEKSIYQGLMENANFKELEGKINYTFKNKELLKNALTHKTFAFEAKKPIEFNERLEFLGDSILGFLVAEGLYKSNQYFSEGELTRRRSTLVNNTFLAEKAMKIELGKYLSLGKGETKQEGDKNPTNIANAMEALIGAVYLDSSIVKVKKFILNLLFDGKNKF